MRKKLEKLNDFRIGLGASKFLNGGTMLKYDSEKKDHGNGDSISSTKKDVDTVSNDTSWDDY
jgi:hypothetical protein